MASTWLRPFGVEHQPVNGRRCAGDRFPDAGLDVVDIGEEQPVVQPVDQHTRHELRGRMQSHIGIAVEPVHPAQYRVVGLGASPDGVDDRQGDGHTQGL